MDYNVKKELSKWVEKVIYDVSFKENTKANLSKLRDILNKASFEKFTIISANSEPLVYKIGRFFIEEGIKCDDFKFVDGKIIETYLSGDTPDWKKKDSLNEFFEIFKDDFRNKWVVIPYMAFEISPALAINFIYNFKKADATGLLFYAEGPNNIAEILTTSTDLENFYQFPKADYYTRRKRILPDDEW